MNSRPRSSKVQNSRRLGTNDLSAEVDVERHRRVGMPQLVGHLPRGEPGLVEARGDGLAEGVRGDPTPRSLLAADPPPCHLRLDRAVLAELVAGAVAGFAV